MIMENPFKNGVIIITNRKRSLFVKNSLSFLTKNHCPVLREANRFSGEKLDYFRDLSKCKVAAADSEEI